MMKKMKGVAHTESSSPNTDLKIRLKHHSLMQDFGELQRETQAMRERLERMKKRKLTLKAEVGFLRRRYKHLMKNQSPRSTRKKVLLPPQSAETLERKIAKGKNFSVEGTFLRQQAPIYDLDCKDKVPFRFKKQAAPRPPVPIFELDQKGRTRNGNEKKIQDLVAPVLELDQTGRVNGGRATPLRNVTPVFDLNQVSMEEEELQANYEPLTAEELRNSSVRGGSDEQLKEMKLSLCRNAGDNSSRAAGKRKISWQDQVALRV